MIQLLCHIDLANSGFYFLCSFFFSAWHNETNPILPFNFQHCFLHIAKGCTVKASKCNETNILLTLYIGKTYHIPVCIYLRKDYPCYPPYCYVMPTAGMSLVMSRNLDGKGMVYLPYLSDWKKVSLFTALINHMHDALVVALIQDKCNLHNLVQVLIVTFTEECPVYSHRNRSSNQQHAHQLLSE